MKNTERKSLIFKLMSISISIIILLVGTFIIYNYYIKSSYNRAVSKEKIYQLGTNTLEENYTTDKYFNFKVLKPNTKVSAIKKIDDNLVYDAVYTSDKNSFRQTKGNIKGNTYIFMGCSYMFGVGVNDDETIPYCFSKISDFKYNVINAAFPSTATYISYALLESNKLIECVDTKIEYIIYEFFSDHIYRNLVGSNIVYKIDNGNLVKVEKGEPIEIFTNKILQLKYKEKGLNLTVKLLEEMNKLAKEKYNSKFLVVLYEFYDHDNITKELKELLDNSKIENIYTDIKINENNSDYYRIRNDDHLTRNANKEIAQKIYNYIFNK